MERYSLEWMNKHIDSLTDKLGSDYFTAPVKYDRFITVTMDFLRESTEYIELNQEISDDIKPLLVRTEKELSKNELSVLKNIWNLPEPADYFRLISAVPVTKKNDEDLILAKQVTILKEGQANAYERDPFRCSSAEYPNVYRIGDKFLIDVGSDKNVYHKALISYVRKPIFAKDCEKKERIVDLSDLTIEKLCLMTADSLRVSTGDVTAATNFQFNSGFGKKNK